MSDDPVADFLRALPTSDRARAAAWDAVHTVKDDATAQQLLQQLPFSDEVRARLWDARSGKAIEPMTFERPPLKAENPTVSERAGYGAAGDVVTGALKGAAHTVLDLGQTAHAIPGVSKAVDALYGTPGLSDASFKQARNDTAYANTAQKVGGVAEAVAELAMPVTKAAEAVPSTARAGRAFQDVMGAAKSILIDVSEPGKVALRINELAERGGSMPMAARKFLKRVTNPNLADMTYEEARDFASNISRLSADEYGRLTPVVSREVANLRVALNKSIAEAAQKAGKLSEYESAMKEYARAARLRDGLADVWKGVKRGIPYATGTGAGYYAAQKLKELFSGD